MAFSHTTAINLASASGTLERTKAYSGSSETNLSESVVTASTDLAITCAIDVSAVKSFYVVSDQAVTLETNSGSSPTNTLTLVAGVPYQWNTDSYNTFKLTGDVTVIYVTNASGSTAAIELRCIQDATP